MPLGRSCKRGKVPTLWDIPSPAGDQQRQSGSSRASEENTATALWQPERRETCTDGQCHDPTLSSLRNTSAGSGGSWVLKHRLQRSNLGEKIGVGCMKQPEEAEV